MSDTIRLIERQLEELQSALLDARIAAAERGEGVEPVEAPTDPDAPASFDQAKYDAEILAAKNEREVMEVATRYGRTHQDAGSDTSVIRVPTALDPTRKAELNTAIATAGSAEEVVELLRSAGA